MKRKAGYSIVVVALLLLAYSAFLGPQSSRVPTPSPALAAAAEGLDAYTFDLVMHPSEYRIGVTMNARIQNRWDKVLPDIVLRTYAGAYKSLETSPAATEELFDRCYPHGFSPGDFLLHDVTVNGKAVSPAFDDAARTVLRLPVEGFVPDTWCDVSLRMVLTVPDCLHRFGRSDGVWLLGNCLPILSVVDEGEWRTDPYVSIGDPFVSAVANYSVSFSGPEGVLLAASAPMQKTEDGRFTGTAQAVRDFALVVYEQGVSVSARMDGTLVQSIARTRERAGKPLQIAKEVLKHYNQVYGAYPYPTLKVAAVPFAFSGMEYPALVWISDALYGQGLEGTLELTVAHELAHQWFYAVVGSDAFRNPWQDEALSEHAMLQYVRKRYGADGYDTLARLRLDAPMRENIREGITPGSPLDHFHDMEEYASVVYGRGAAALQALDQHTSGRMDGFLKAYVASHAFGYATRQDFEQGLNEYLKEDVRELLIDYLDTSM